MSAYQYLPSYEDEEDVGYVEPVEIEAIIPPALPLNMKFDIISDNIQLLNLRGVFVGLPIDDLNLHLAYFIGIFTPYTTLGVNQESLRLRLFPLTLPGKASLWLVELSRGSITT